LIAQNSDPTISYLTGRERQTRFNLMNVNTGEIRQIPIKVEPIYTYDWSPDGQNLVIDNGEHIYIVNTEGAVVQTLMNSTKTLRYSDPAWSPDGTEIALLESSGSGIQLILVNVATGELRYVLQPNASMYGSIVWSPDGQYIAVSSSVSTPVASFVINVPACLAAPESCYESSIRLSGLVSDWSQDGHSMLLANGESELRLFVDEILPKLSNPDCLQDYLNPCLSGDSRQLVLEYPPTPNPETSAYTGQYEEAGRWSADGSQIVFGTYEFTFGRRDLYLVDADGSHLRKLTDDYEEQRLPRWRPA
jgi:Tol biopolymer transport system component